MIDILFCSRFERNVKRNTREGQSLQKKRKGGERRKKERRGGGQIGGEGRKKEGGENNNVGGGGVGGGEIRSGRRISRPRLGGGVEDAQVEEIGAKRGDD